MKKLHIEPCKDSPEIILDPNSNIFSIKGICHPENVPRFFEPVLAWFDDFKQELIAKEETRDVKIIFLFRYFNSATYKYLITIFSKIHELQNIGCNLFVEWQYEEDDEEMKESGEELFEFSGLQIPYVCVESEL